VGLGFRTQGHLETVMLAEFSNFLKRKFLFLRQVAAVGGQILQ
jgi:hypothetical protein